MRVVIVGAGVAGLSIGWRLRQAGAEAIVLERAEPGRGATWASAGMIAATAELGHEDGPEAELARRSSGLWPGFAAEIEQAAGIAIHYRQTGAIIAALDTQQAQALKTSASRNPGARWVGAREALTIEPLLCDQIVGALCAPGEAFVDNRALGRALTLAFTKAGGKLSRTEPATELIAEGGRAVAVRTPFQRYEADAFVMAAGAWSGQMFGLPPELKAVKPIKGEMIALDSPEGTAVPAQLIWGNGIYLVPRRSQILCGATVADAGFDTRVTDAARDYLRSRAESLVPELSRWTLADHWAGLRPGSPDGLPLLGLTSLTGLYAATGQYRNGILFAPAIADAVSSAVLEQKMPTELAAFDPSRFV